MSVVLSQDTERKRTDSCGLRGKARNLKLVMRGTTALGVVATPLAALRSVVGRSAQIGRFKRLTTIVGLVAGLLGIRRGS